MNRKWMMARIVGFMAFVLFLSPLGLSAKDLGNESDTVGKMHVEKVAKSQVKHAEHLAKTLKHQEKFVQKNLKIAQKKMQALQEHLEEIMPEMERQMHESMSALAQADITIPEIHIPEIKVPEIHIPEIKIPHVPAPPSIGQVGENFKGEKVSETVEKSFAVQPGTPLKVDCSFSAIWIESVEPGEKPSTIEISVTKEGGADTKEMAHKILDRIEIEIEQTDEDVEVRVNLSEDQENSINSNNTLMHSTVKIVVPTNTPIDVRNSFGDVSIRNSQGPIRSENKFGQTYIEGSKGKLHVSSEYGRLTVKQHEGDGWVRGQFGDVLVSGLTGNLEVEVNYGETTLETENPTACIEGKFSFGSVDMNLPKEYSGRIQAFSSFGEISAPEGLTKKKEMFDESVEGEIGSGKGQIRINSSYSPVKIRCKE